MAMVLSYEVVEVWLIQVLITIDRVESGSESEESQHCHKGEDDTIPSKEAFL